MRDKLLCGFWACVALGALAWTAMVAGGHALPPALLSSFAMSCWGLIWRDIDVEKRQMAYGVKIPVEEVNGDRQSARHAVLLNVAEELLEEGVIECDIEEFEGKYFIEVKTHRIDF